MSNFVYAGLFVLGLVFGSFLNVLTIRFDPRGRFFAAKNVRGRSRCMSCQKQLAWYELIPLASFALQVGKCRSCRARLSWQYPAVELATALIFAGVPLFLNRFFAFWDPSLSPWLFAGIVALWMAVFILMLIAFIVDVRHYIIPNAVNALLFVLGVVWVFLAWHFNLFENLYGGSFLRQYAAVFPAFANPWLSHLAGAALGSALFLLIVVFSRGRAMGVGDVKLIGALGILFGWPDIIPLIFWSFILGSLVAMVLLARKRKGMADQVPFGPFIVAASALVFFAGPWFMSLYFGLIGA